MGPRLKQSLSVIEKQNELKHKLKRTLQKLDDGNIHAWHLTVISIDKMGYVKQSVFFQILECLDINVDAHLKAKIVRNYEKNDKISYLEAVRALYINPIT